MTSVMMFLTESREVYSCYIASKFNCIVIAIILSTNF